MLRIEDLTVTYGRVRAVNGLSMHVDDGEFVGLVGHNGAGKTSTLMTIVGTQRPTSGTIDYDGTELTRCAPDQILREGISLVPEGRRIFARLTVGENVRIGGNAQRDRSAVAKAVERMRERFPVLADKWDRSGGELSGGEQQQLATARALIAQPELLMIDELSLGLAPLVIERLMETVQRLVDEEGLTIVVVEQQATFALGYTDRAYFLEKGEVRYDGPSSGLTERADLLRSVFLAGASSGFAEGES